VRTLDPNTWLSLALGQFHSRPAARLYGAAGFSWRQVQTEARARLTRTIDMLHEHALRSFEMQEAILAAADGRVAGMSWEEIAASREVHVFLRNLDASVPSSNAVGLVGPDGRIASFSRLAFPTPPINLADREYLRPARAGMAGTFISEVIEARPTGTRVFVLSRARSGSDGKPHGGVVTSALSPSYFADFYGDRRTIGGRSVPALNGVAPAVIFGTAFAFRYRQAAASVDLARIKSRKMRRTSDLRLL
jgi:hypothetical protein